MKTTTLFIVLITSLVLLAGNTPSLAQVAECGVQATIPPQMEGGSPSRGSGSLTTTFDWNNLLAGNMFDLMPYEDLTITGFDLNLSPPGETALVDVYYRVGSCVGFEQNSSAWSLFDSGSVLIVAAGLPSFLDLAGNNIVLEAGTTYGFYVDLVTYSPWDQHILFTGGSPTNYWNDDLVLTSHCGNDSPAFSGFVYPWIWNGTVYYETDDPHFAHLTVTPEPLITGQNVTFSVSNAITNANTWIAYSLDGFGTTPVPLLNITLGIANAQKLVGPKRTNWAGRVEWTFPVPTTVPPGTVVWFQAAQYNLTSYIATSTVLY